MSTYILVHGAWHGAWCWYRVIPLLQKQGHKVIATDLPGHGIDRSMPLASGTLRANTDHIKRILEAQSEPVILVGHSLGGLTITRVAEEAPESLQKLVYLSAYLIANGTNIVDTHRSVPSSIPVSNHLTFDKTNSVVYLRADRLRELLYHDCNENDITLARTLLTAEPTGVMFAQMQSGERFAHVPRVYIESLNDQIIKLDIQRYMQQNFPCERVFSLPTSHSPFFAAPESLVDILASLA